MVRDYWEYLKDICKLPDKAIELADIRFRGVEDVAEYYNSPIFTDITSEQLVSSTKVSD